MNCNEKIITNKYESISHYFRSVKYNILLIEAKRAFEAGNFDKLKDILDLFPSKDELFTTLAEKLKGKSIDKTLKLIKEGKSDINTNLKGLLSLATHVTIEAKENYEYYMLLPEIYENIGRLLYDLGKGSEE